MPKPPTLPPLSPVVYCEPCLDRGYSHVVPFYCIGDGPFVLEPSPVTCGVVVRLPEFRGSVDFFASCQKHGNQRVSTRKKRMLYLILKSHRSRFINKFSPITERALAKKQQQKML